jgi:hypothetical protein
MNRRSKQLNSIGQCGLALLFAAWCGIAPAQVPQMLNYQGFLTNSAGTPVNSPVMVTFRVYNAASGALPPLYTEVQPSVNVTNGVFDTIIGSITPLTLPFDVPYWLTVTIDADGEMAPRQLVTASPYALNSANAAALAPTATVGGSQLTGSITTGTLPTGNLTGTIGSAQIADNAVTQAKLSPVSGAAPGKVLGTDGANLQWQSAGAGGPSPATTVVSETAFGQAPSVGASANYAREDHTHGTPTLPALAGDVTGSITGNTVAGLQGRTVSAAAPANAQVLTWNAGSSQWQPATPAVVPPAPVIAAWAGGATVVPHGIAAYSFIGPSTSVVVPAGGRITASASGALTTAAGTATIKFGICYQVGSGSLSLLAGAINWLDAIIGTTYTHISAHSSLGGFAAGSYSVGLCGSNPSATDANTDWVNGWVMVTAS